MSQTHDGSTPWPAASAGSWWAWLAVGMAVAAALAWLASALTTMSLDAALIGATVMYVAVPAVGVWVASRRHGPMGLAVIATWGALAGLPALAWWVVQLGLRSGLSRLEVLLWSVLAVAALVAALKALATQGDRAQLAAPGRRKAAAAAVAVWGVAEMGVDLLWPVGSDLFHVANVRPVLSTLVLLGLAAVIWRGDRVTAVAAVLVINLGAVLQVGYLVARSEEMLRAAPTPMVIAVILVQVAAVVGLTAAAARLTVAARTDA